VGLDYERRWEGVFEAHRLLYHSTLGLRKIKQGRGSRVPRCGFQGPGSGSRGRNVKRFLVFKAHRRLHHSTLGLESNKDDTSRASPGETAPDTRSAPAWVVRELEEGAWPGGSRICSPPLENATT